MEVLAVMWPRSASRLNGTLRMMLQLVLIQSVSITAGALAHNACLV